MLWLARNVAMNSVLSIHYEYILIAVSLNVDLKMCQEHMLNTIAFRLPPPRALTRYIVSNSFQCTIGSVKH